jgi:hypothetical protein
MIRGSKIFKITELSDIPKSGLSNDLIVEDIHLKMRKVFDMDDRANLIISSIGNDVFIRDDGKKAKYLFDVLFKHYDCILEDVSNDVIMNNNIINHFGELEEQYTKPMFELYRLDYSSKDDILDKIVDNGIDYLDPIDLEILNK